MTFEKFIRENKIFLLLYALFLIGGGMLLAEMKKGDETLYFNSLHSGVLDQLFKWTTRIAEAPMLVLIIIVVLRFSYGKGLLLALNNLLVFICMLVFKGLVFTNEPRPALYFEGKEPLHFVQGVQVFGNNSFPSGHTAAAFALFFMLNILIRDKRWSILFFLLAFMVGLSRVYLLEHFFSDVYFGSLLGMVITTMVYLLFAESGFYKNLGWKDKALFNN